MAILAEPLGSWELPAMSSSGGNLVRARWVGQAHPGLEPRTYSVLGVVK